MLLIGLTGGIGSGKSTVARLLREKGAVIIDADVLAREELSFGTETFKQVVDRFGQAILDERGDIDRLALADLVFHDAEALASLNALVHPRVAERISELLAKEASTDNVVVLDIPLLSEDRKRELSMDGLIVVDAPREVALQRLVDQRGMRPEDASARIAVQQDRFQRRSMADFVIDNAGSLVQLEEAVEDAWKWILRLRQDQ
ncbi:MAG: dephospho-CoA kinase [Actinobacteria bacterium]|jgi:dephospho-CoA kinase|nr:dephospho-CoA kinase [Actinomycetota bacterium]